MVDEFTAGFTSCFSRMCLFNELTQVYAVMYAPRSVMQDAALQHTQQFQDDPHEQKYGGIDFDAGPPCFADDAFNLQLDL